MAKRSRPGRCLSSPRRPSVGTKSEAQDEQTGYSHLSKHALACRAYDQRLPMAPAIAMGQAETKGDPLMPDTPINATYPSSDDLRLQIALGACRLEAKPGEGEAWITGICHDPTGKRAPRIAEEEGSVRITESEPSLERIPEVFGGIPRYELAIGKRRPFALIVETGASEFEMDLGGVPVSSLMVR